MCVRCVENDGAKMRANVIQRVLNVVIDIHTVQTFRIPINFVRVLHAGVTILNYDSEFVLMVARVLIELRKTMY